MKALLCLPSTTTNEEEGGRRGGRLGKGRDREGKEGGREEQGKKTQSLAHFLLYTRFRF